MPGFERLNDIREIGRAARAELDYLDFKMVRMNLYDVQYYYFDTRNNINSEELNMKIIGESVDDVIQDIKKLYFIIDEDFEIHIMDCCLTIEGIDRITESIYNGILKNQIKKI